MKIINSFLRFTVAHLSLAISKDFAHQKNGKIRTTAHQDSEQLNRRRELLAVEEEANKNKIIQAHGQEHFKSQVMNQFLQSSHQSSE